MYYGKTNYWKVYQFHEVFNQPRPDLPTLQDKTTQDLRIALIEEEVKEIKEALAKGDIVNLAQELVDLLYVTYGAGVTFGLPLDKVFDEVQRANLSKLGEDGKPIYREDGKVLKGPNFKPADVKSVLDQHIAEKFAKWDQAISMMEPFTGADEIIKALQDGKAKAMKDYGL